MNTITSKLAMSSRPLRVVVAVAAVAAPLAIALAVRSRPGGKTVGTALVLGAAFLATLLIALEWVGSTSSSNDVRQRYGYFEIVVGLDGRLSSSRTVAAAWTLLFATTLVVISGTVWSGASSAQAALGSQLDAILVLLGAPFGAAIGAKALEARADPDTRSLTVAASPAAFPASVTGIDQVPKVKDLVTNDVGDLSLANTQYVIFSAVTALYFVGAFTALLINYAAQPCTAGATACAAISIPEIPAALLGLLGVGATTYTTSKALPKAAPQPTESIPTGPGEDVAIPAPASLRRSPSAPPREAVALFFHNGAPAGAVPAALGNSDGRPTYVARAPSHQGTYDVRLVGPTFSTREEAKVVVT